MRADREGLWLLHLATVQKLQPVFAVFDRTNYIRWSSIYREDMRKLPETAPADMCLEQTINRSQKSTGGVIGETRRKSFVTEWEIIYHEILSVSNLYREITYTRTQDYELTIHHEFTKTQTQYMESQIQSTYDGFH